MIRISLLSHGGADLVRPRVAHRSGNRSAELCGPGFIRLVDDALARFGRKPLLVVCDAPAERVEYLQAYDNGMKLASIARTRVAIVLGGRDPTDVDRLTDLAATNRGTQVRSFRDLPAAKAWLAVD